MVCAEWKMQTHSVAESGETLVQLVLNQIDFLALNARQKLLVQLFKLKKKKMSPEGVQDEK